MDLWKTIKSWKKSERKFKVLLKDPELEPNCLQRRQFCTNFTVEALVPRLAVAVVATNSIFAKSSMCTRQWLTCVAICRTKKAISGVLMRCILYQRFLNLSNWRHRTNALPTYVAQNSLCKNKIKTENKILFFLKHLKSDQYDSLESTNYTELNVLLKQHCLVFTFQLLHLDNKVNPKVNWTTLELLDQGCFSTFDGARLAPCFQSSRLA